MIQFAKYLCAECIYFIFISDFVNAHYYCEGKRRPNTKYSFQLKKKKTVSETFTTIIFRIIFIILNVIS